MTRRSRQPCIQPDCDRPHFGRGFCQTHLYRHHHGLDMEAPFRRKRICTLDGCTRSHLARGLCAPHYARVRRTGHLGDTAIRKYTGRKVDAYGYVQIWNPEHPLAQHSGYIYEHRMVVHDAGVEIPEGYDVHHINGDQTDNRLENLEVLSKAEHARRHRAAATP